jgi:glycosyltransferase involved in cell wall biosynthesis
MPPPEVSLVIPVCNEAESLKTLHAEIDAVAKSLDRGIEIVFIDDGSRDESWALIQSLAKSDSRVRGIRFRRNFGKAAALAAGFRLATGAVVFTLDADLQDDPKEIPRFLAMLDSFDVISGWKKIRHDPWHKVLPSRVFNALVSRVTGVNLHDHNCGFKCYRRAVIDEVRLYGERHRFVPVLAAARGFRVGELVIEHRARRFGQSKYGFRRFLRGFLDLITIRMLTGSAGRPQHLFGGLAVLPFVAGIILAILAAVSGLAGSAQVTILLAIAAVGSLMVSTQLFLTGLLAETILERTLDPHTAYAISETT